MVLGLIDPLEGGIALLIAIVIYAVGFSVAKEKPSKWLWIPLVTTIVIGAVTLVAAILQLEFSQEPTGLPGPVIFGLWAYRAAGLVTLIGSIITVVKSFQKDNPKKI